MVNTHITWIVVAHRAGARIFSHVGRGKPLEPVAEIDHPEGRKQTVDIDTDRSGRNRDPGGGGAHATTHKTDSHEHIAERFAHDLAHRLRGGRNDHEYGRLVLVAEPHFLGLLRGQLDHDTAKLVIGTVDKDLAQSKPDEIVPRLAAVLSI